MTLYKRAAAYYDDAVARQAAALMDDHDERILDAVYEIADRILQEQLFDKQEELGYDTDEN